MSCARRVRAVAFIVPLIAQLACGASGDERAAKLKVIASWATTARMVGEAWAADRVPDAYAVRTLETATRTINEEVENAEPTTQAQLRGRVQKLKGMMDRMRTAIKVRDRSSLTETLNQLAAETQTLEHLTPENDKPQQ